MIEIEVGTASLCLKIAMSTAFGWRGWLVGYRRRTEGIIDQTDGLLPDEDLGACTTMYEKLCM